MKTTILLSALLAASIMILSACSSGHSTGQASGRMISEGGHAPRSVIGSR